MTSDMTNNKTLSFKALCIKKIQAEKSMTSNMSDSMAQVQKLSCYNMTKEHAVMLEHDKPIELKRQVFDLNEAVEGEQHDCLNKIFPQECFEPLTVDERGIPIEPSWIEDYHKMSQEYHSRKSVQHGQ